LEQTYLTQCLIVKNGAAALISPTRQQSPLPPKYFNPTRGIQRTKAMLYKLLRLTEREENARINGWGVVGPDSIDFPPDLSPIPFHLKDPFHECQ
jgi:hypothetical protein